MTSSDVVVLKEALSEAQQLGYHGPEVRRARDALLTLEASEFSRRASCIVDEAIEADDWWKYQAAMQVVVGGMGADSEPAKKLKGAMRLQNERKAATREVRKATEAQDVERLRKAIENAKRLNTKDVDFKKAKAELRALEPVC